MRKFLRKCLALHPICLKTFVVLNVCSSIYRLYPLWIGLRYLSRTIQISTSTSSPRFCASCNQLIQTAWAAIFVPVQPHLRTGIWLYWRDPPPGQPGSADCYWRRIVFQYSLSYSAILLCGRKHRSWAAQFWFHSLDGLLQESPEPDESKPGTGGKCARSSSGNIPRIYRQLGQNKNYIGGISHKQQNIKGNISN